MINKIPLIIPVFNQLSYLKNTINWFKKYYPENPIVILNNASTYKPLLDFLDESSKEFNVYHFAENDCAGNLSAFLDFHYDGCGYPDNYIITDPDLEPCGNTPNNFLEEFKRWIDAGYHRAGFGLRTDDIPEWNKKRGEIIFNEEAVLSRSLERNEQGFLCYRAPIDTTFCLYSRSNGGWSSPMSGENWDRCVRVFEMYHLPWYIHPATISEEMKNYFDTCRKHEPGMPSAGLNNHRPY